MYRMPPVNLRRNGSEVVESFDGDRVTNFREGPDGWIILKGGPRIGGHVSVARSLPLGQVVCPNPTDRTEQQIAHRNGVGQQMIEIAKSGILDEGEEALDRMGLISQT